MSDIAVQASFNSGEWAPALFARVDIQKWRSGAALLQNFFVDYRGGASSRPGSKYIIQCLDSAHPTRLIPFQAAFNLGYELEFGQNYIRFIYQGAPVVEAPFSITAATRANPCVLTVPGHNYSIGDWIFVSGVGGMVQLNGRYFVVENVAGNNVTLYGTGALFSSPIDSTTFGVYTSGGTTARIYKIASPYAAADLGTLKFAQSGTNIGMVLTHPNYPPYELVLISATNWTITAISFGSTAAIPGGVASSTQLPVADIYTTPIQIGQTYYSYVVTSIDSSGQESQPSAVTTIGPPGHVDYRTYPGSNFIGWAPATNAVAYNVYAAELNYFGVAPAGAVFGFIGYTNGTTFIDSNIAADFSQTPPIHQNPFAGSGIAYITVTAAGTYTTVPAVTLSGGSPSIPASAGAVLSAVSTPTITAGGSGFQIGDTVNFGNGLVLVVTGISSGAITSWAISSAGSITSGSTPSNPISQATTTGAGTGAQATVTWGVGQVIVTGQGAGYSSAPTVSFSSGAATATATLSPTGNGNPSAVGFYQQRLCLAGALGAPQTFNLSRPGNYFNYDTHLPVQADDAITGTLVSNVVNSIKSIVSMAAGMLVFTDKAAWVVNGGSFGAPISPTGIVATQAQSWIGASDVPPIVSNFDVLYVQSKGSVVRDLTYNIWFQIFSGTDISVYSSHLFYGFTIKEWAWGEQPFYVVWAVRNDGTMLTLTFLKEQEFVGWTHQVTQGSYQSVATITEPTSSAGTVDAIYTIVSRSVGGSTLNYIERIAERSFPNGLSSAWCVDCGLQYSGSPALNFWGAEQLGGLTVTGLATDNLGNVTIITPFTMPTSGLFSLPAPPSPATGYTVVTIGLGFTCQLQTLPLDTGEPSIQGKPKKIPYVDVRVNQTLGLEIGASFSTLVPMKDLVQGNVSSMLTGQGTQLVNGLYTGDARTFLDPTYTIPGQYCIQQSNPYPASILGLFPAFVVGDDR